MSAYGRPLSNKPQSHHYQMTKFQPTTVSSQPDDASIARVPKPPSQKGKRERERVHRNGETTHKGEFVASFYRSMVGKDCEDGTRDELGLKEDSSEGAQLNEKGGGFREEKMKLIRNDKYNESQKGDMHESEYRNDSNRSEVAVR